MIRQRKVLELIAERTRKGRQTSYRSLAREFELSIHAGCGHLARLWRERLIEATTDRPPRYQFRLGDGESIRDLYFMLSKRGEERLARFAEQDQDGDWF